MYGGTKQEMMRLIEDANEYGASIGKASDLSIDSFSDIITAIQLIQEKQKIAGTTSKEAASTIEGSFNALKASWENLLTGFSNSNANVAKLTKTVAKNAMTAFDNVLPVAKQALTGIGEAIETIAPIISKKLPKVLNDLLPAATTAIGNLLKGIGSALPGLITTLVPTVVNSVKNLFNSLWNAIPSMIKSANALFSAGAEIVNQLASGISKNFSKIVPIAMNLLTKFSENLRSGAGKLVDAGLKLIMALADGLIKNIPTLIKTVPTIISNLAGIINDNAPKLLKAGATLIVKLAKGIIDSIPTLVKEFPKIIKAVVDVWTAFNWLNLGKAAITAIKNGIKNVGPKIVSGLKDIGSKAINAFKNVNWAGVGKTVITTTRNAISGAADLILAALRTIGNNGIKAFKSVDWAAVGKAVINFIAKAARGAFDLVKSALAFVANQAKSAFTNIDWAELGRNIVRGIAGGIGALAREAYDAAKNMAQGVLNRIASTFDENSPSKETEKQAKYLVEGIIIGIKNNEKNAEKSAQELGELILQASENQLNNHKVYNDTSLELEAAYWDKVREQVEEGTQARIDADTKYIEANKAYNEELEKIEQESNKKSLSAWQNVIETLSGLAGKVVENASLLHKEITGSVLFIKDTAKKAGEDYNSILLSSAEKRLSNYKVYRDIDLKDEVAYWNEIRKKVKKGTQARIDADAKYFEVKKNYTQKIKEQEEEANKAALTAWESATVLLRGTNGKVIKSSESLYASIVTQASKLKSLAKKAGEDYNSILLSAAEKRLANAKLKRNVDLAEEVEYWNKIRKQIKKGTQERIDADAKYKDSLKSYREAIKKTVSDAESLASGFAKSFNEINTSLEQSISEVEKKYADALEERASGLTSSISLFEQFKKADLPKYTEIVGIDENGEKITREVTANSNMLINNLQSQVYAIHEWNSILDNLTNRLGGNNPLLKQFESMGVNSYDTLKLINDMTDEQLQTYVDLYNQYAAEAMNRAKAENQSLKEQTKTDIEQLKKDAADKIKSLKDQYAKDLQNLAKESQVNGEKVGKSINKGVKKGIKDTTNEVKEAARTISQKVLNTKSEAQNSGKSIGDSIAKGIERGLKNGQSGVTSMARQVAIASWQAAKQALDINSPSKKFAWIGEMVDKGLASGIDKNTSVVDNAMSNIAKITDFQPANDFGTVSSNSAIGANTSNTTITMNVYGAPGQDVKALADEVERRLNSKVARGGVAFA